MHTRINRRRFLRQASTLVAGAALAAGAGCASRGGGKPHPLFDISLAQWSLNRALRQGRLDNLDFARTARRDYGIHAIEYVNQFFSDKARDHDYLRELKKCADDEGVRTLLVMIDGEGPLGAADPAQRMRAVENHYKWVEAAKFLGAHSIRVNAEGNGSYADQINQAADGLRRLSEFAAPHGINILVENHGGFSSNGQWLAAVMRLVGLPNCGTLPDFGNFQIAENQWYDRYQGVAELMPYAQAVSAKSNDFDEYGDEVHTDFLRMMRLVLDAGYRGHVGIEYDGNMRDEPEGIRLTKRLLEKVRAELAPSYRG